MQKIFGRLMSALLAVSLVMPTAFAARTSTYEEDVQLLIALGIIAQEPASEDAYATRAEFISAVANIYCEEIGTAEKSDFSDVSKRNPYYDELMAASTAGLAMGDETSRLRPDDAISVKEAELVLERLCGVYGGTAAPDFGYTKGYTDMTWKNAARLLCDILDENMLSVKISGDAPAYEKTDETVLEHYRSIYKLDGIVGGADGIYIDSADELADGKIVIDGTELDTDGDDFSDFLGKNVKSYYREDTKNDVRMLVYIREYKNKTLRINAKDIDDTEGKTISYKVDDKSKTAQLSANIDVIYNGSCMTDYDSSDFKIKSGYIELVDNNNDGRYELVRVQSFKTYVIDSVDSINSVLYLKYNDGQTVKADFNADNRTVSVKNTKGYDVDLRELRRGDVICAYESPDGKKIRAIHCIDEITGVIDGLESDGDEYTITIDGENYDITDSCIKNQSSLLKIGTSAMFTLDLDGAVAYIYNSSQSSMYAYVMRAFYDGELDRVGLKLLCEDGKISNLMLREKCDLDGVRYNDAATLWGAMGGKDFGRRLIKIKLTSGEIKEIFTDGTLKNGGFEMFYTDYTYTTGEPKKKSDNAKHYFKDTGIIATKVAVGADTIVMIVPNSKDTTDEKYFKVDNTYLKDDVEVWVEAYRGSDDGYTADVVVAYDDVSADYAITDQNTTVCVLDKMSAALDADDERIYNVTLFENGEKNTYPTRDEEIIKYVYGGITPKRGDVIRYELKDGVINKLELIYSAQTKQLVASEDVTHADANNKYFQFRVWDAYAFYRFGSYMLLSRTRPTDAENFDYSGFDLHTCANSSIVIVDTEDDALYRGTADDIIGFKNTKGAECSRVVVQERYTESKCIVIYR